MQAGCGWGRNPQAIIAAGAFFRGIEHVGIAYPKTPEANGGFRSPAPWKGRSAQGRSAHATDSAEEAATVEVWVSLIVGERTTPTRTSDRF